MQPAARARLANLALMLASLGVVFGALEIWFRLRPVSDLPINDEYSYREQTGERRFRVPFHTWTERYPPSLDVRGYYAPSDYQVEFAFNQFGARWRAAEPQPIHGRVVLVLGDSFTYGSGLRYADTWVSRLEQALNAAGDEVTLLNFGESGADTTVCLRNYRELQARVPHDEVLYAIHLNDFVGFSTSFVIRNPALSLPIARDSLFIQWALGRIDTAVGRRLKIEYLTSPRAFERNHFRNNLRAIEELAEETRARGVALRVALLPVLVDVAQDSFRPVYVELARQIEARGMQLLDVTRSVRGHRDADLWMLPVDQHPNEIASAEIARALAARLAAARPQAVRRAGLAQSS